MALSVLPQVQQIAADSFGLPSDSISLHSSADDIEAWDSMAHLKLVLALEQSFDLQFLPEEIIQMSNIELIALLIEEKLGANA